MRAPRHPASVRRAARHAALLTMAAFVVISLPGSAGADPLVEPAPTRSSEATGSPCGPQDCLPVVGPRREVQCPSGSVMLSPDRKLQAVIAGHPEGTTFCFRRGLYRLKDALLPKSHDVFIGEYGARLRGSKVVTDWRRREGFWVATDQRQEGEVILGVPCKANIACNRPEGLFIDERQLVHVASLSAVRPGRFFFDYANDRIYIADDPRNHRVEASVAEGAFRSTSPNTDGVIIRNLVIERFANPSRTGAIYTSVSPGWVVRDSVITSNHGVGIFHVDRAKILNNLISRNGQVGVGGYRPSHVLVQDNEIAMNAIGGFDGWEAGGAKYAETTDLTFRGNYVHDNRHHGLWTDTDNVGTVFARNTIVRNAGSGIFHEKSGRCRIRGNYIARNRAEGVFIASSSDVEVDGNAIVGNSSWGVRLFIDGGDGHDLADDLIHDNVFELRDGSVVGIQALNVPDPSVYSTSKRNAFQANRYRVPDVSQRYWSWNGGSLTWDGWRGAGQDLQGTVSGS